MEENLYDTALLLGPKYIHRKLSTSEKSLHLIINHNKSIFFQNLLRIINDLLTRNETTSIVTKLKLSKYSIEMFSTIYPLSAICNLCGRYFFRIKGHLIDRHLLTEDQADKHESLFELKGYYYMPKDYKKQEELNLLLSKNKRNKTPKSKLKKAKILITTPKPKEIKLYSKSELEQQNAMICGDCGEFISDKDRLKHIRGHQRNQILTCPNCKKEMKKRYFSDHYRKCFK